MHCKNHYFIWLVLFTAVGCVEVKYENPQPENVVSLPEIPQELKGVYWQEDSNDTLRIVDNPLLDNPTVDRSELLDTLQIKYYEGLYFLNVHERETKLWDLFVIDRKRNGDIKVMRIDANDKKIIERINKFTRVREVKNEHGGTSYYVIQPSKKTLVRLVKNGVFNNKVVYKKLY